ASEPSGEAAGDEAAGRGAAARRTSTAAIRAAIFAFLLGEGRAPPTLPEEELLEALRAMLDEPTDELSTFVARHLADPRVRERWAGLLPPSTLVRLCSVLAPRGYLALIDAAELLTSAWIEAAPPGSQALTDRRVFWSVLMEIFAESAGGDLSVERLTLRFFAHVAARSRADAP